VGPGRRQLGRAHGNGLASHAGVGRGRRRAGPATEKAVHDDFSILNPFSN
jgi:hypothetical protein